MPHTYTHTHTLFVYEYNYLFVCYSVSEGEMSDLFLKFSILDRDGRGLMTRSDFFDKFIQEPRHFVADAIFNLIGIAVWQCAHI
jgi:hypothetical protein